MVGVDVTYNKADRVGLVAENYCATRLATIPDHERGKKGELSFS